MLLLYQGKKLERGRDRGKKRQKGRGREEREERGFSHADAHQRLPGAGSRVSTDRTPVTTTHCPPGMLQAALSTIPVVQGGVPYTLSRKITFLPIKKKNCGTALVAQWLRICLQRQGTRMGSIPGAGTKIPHAPEQLRSCTTALSPGALESVLCDKKSHLSER